MNKEIISILIGQHRELQKDIEFVEGFLGDDFDADKILKGLEEFRGDLDNHLKIENGFYGHLLKTMKEAGNDTEKTEKFISEMVCIGAAVYGFLDKYNSKENIEKEKESFKVDLPDIKKALWLRIESEEEGVYMYAQAF